MRALANQYARNWYQKNKAKVKARTLKYQREHPEKVRAWQIKLNYGITQDQYDAMLENQGGLCAICKTSDPKGSGSWHIDHDHVTKKVRGLLCNNCNLGLGYFADNKVSLISALGYLSAF